MPGAPPKTCCTATDVNGRRSQGFAIDSGQYTLSGGAYRLAQAKLGVEAVAVFNVDDWLPTYFELKASIFAGKQTGGHKSNACQIFDYQLPNDFKFAGVDVSLNKMVVGHRNAWGGLVEEQKWDSLSPARSTANSCRSTALRRRCWSTTQTCFSHTFAIHTNIYGIWHRASRAVATIDNVVV